MNLMDLFIKVGVKDEASGPLKKLTGAVGGGLKAAAKVGVAAVGAAATGIAALTKQAVSAYADYEQLVGGVETLFSNLDGTVSAAPQVLENAAKAYQTAGLSANQYMETVTSFSAALVAGLEGDYEAAARISDMAITDMADNANKMGTSMDAIQNAYQGFAKQNYTMLDNLKLGYGGTKTEMERLLADAKEFSGVDYNIENLADVYEAIHVIQTEMGITGTTAKEASSTISGSMNMMKAAGQNLLTGIANPNGDLKKLFGNLKTSVKTFLGNLKPIVKQSLSSIGELVAELGPEIAQELPGLMNDLLPDLISSAIELVSGLAQALPGILQTLVDNIPSFLDMGKNLFANFAEGFSGNIDEITNSINSVIDKIAEWLKDEKNLDTLISSAINIVTALAKGIISFAVNITTHLMDLIDEIVKWFAEPGNLEKVKESGGKIVTALWEGMKALWPKVAQWAGGSVGGLFKGIGFGPGTGVGLDNIDWSGAAVGNDYVPYNNYPAMLHRGEAVLTAREADAWRRGEGSGRQIVNNFSFNGVSQSDLDYIVGYVNRELVSG